MVPLLTQGFQATNKSFMRTKIVMFLWIVSYLGTLSYLIFDKFILLSFFIPFVLTSIYIGCHVEDMLYELEMDEDDYGGFKE